MTSQETVNIQVVVRARPLNDSEAHKSTNYITLNRMTNIVEARKKPYSFDAIYPPDTSQTQFFSTAIEPLLQDFLQGFNCSIFAYGYTGSGKTYTMAGDVGNEGVIPQAVSYLFERLNADQIDFYMRCSFMEVYNEEIYDLLEDIREPLKLFEERQPPGAQAPSTAPAGARPSSVASDARSLPSNAQYKQNRLVVQNLTEILVSTPRDVAKLLQQATSNRKTAETLMNERSSRSHSIFCIYLIQKQLEINQNSNQEIEYIKISKLNLVDLAGSENIQKSGATGIQLQEASRINKSLLTFGRVINCLTENKPHVPYRESKLTRLLQDSLGGKTKTTIIATISLSDVYIEETISTLDYMTRAKRIKNAPEIMQKINSKTILKEQTAELKRLRELLEIQKQQQGGIFIGEDEFAQYYQFVNNNTEAIRELNALIQAQVNEIARISAVLDASNAKYSAVKKELRNAIQHINMQYSDLSTFNQKILSGRSVEANNQNNFEAFKVDFQVKVDQNFSIAEINAAEERAGYSKACQDFNSDLNGIQQVIIEQITQFSQNIEATQRRSAEELLKALKGAIDEAVDGIVLDIQHNIAKPMQALSPSDMLNLVVQLVQNRTQFIGDKFKAAYASSETLFQQMIADNQKSVLEHTKKAADSVASAKTSTEKSVSEIQKLLDALQAENASLRQQIKSQSQQLCKAFKESVVQQLESAITDYYYRQEDLLERTSNAFQTKLTETDSGMRKQFSALNQAVDGLSKQTDGSLAAMGQQAAHLLTISQAELNKLSGGVSDTQKNIAALPQFVQQLGKDNIVQPIVAFYQETGQQIQSVAKRTQQVAADARAAAAYHQAQLSQQLSVMLKTLAQKQNSAAQSIPQIGAIQQSVTQLVRGLQHDVNATTLTELYKLQYQTVLPKNRTPVISTPPFRGIGLESSGVVGVQTPTARKSDTGRAPDDAE